MLKLKSIYIYIVSSHKLWCILLGTKFVFLFLFSFRVSQVLDGASRSYFDYTVSPYDDGYVLYLQHK